jgi:hypothetical protein
MYDDITYADLEWLLGEMGFVECPTEGNHKLYRRNDVDALVILPPERPDGSISPGHIVGTRHYLDALGLLGPWQFDKMLILHQAGVYAPDGSPQAKSSARTPVS